MAHFPEANAAAPGAALCLRSTGNLRDWNDIVADAFCGCTVDGSAGAFDANLSVSQIGDLRFTRIRAQPSKVSRWLQGGPKRASGSVLFHLQVAGISINTQRGLSVAVEPGEAALCHPDDLYTVAFPSSYEMIVLEAPVAALDESGAGFDIERRCGRKVDAQRSKLLLGFLAAACQQIDCLSHDMEWRDCVSRTSLGLMSYALAGTRPRGEAGPSGEMRRAVLEHIHRHLDDPALKTSVVARALGISPRSVQGVFERLATTASGFILQKRLDRAASILARQPGRQSITDLAFDCGFSDPAYFSRCFSRRFGVAPRDYRGKAES